jgi:exopolyphosphatase/guanosine-5'-triphosphate,3'-diphosphate pyrophosphatase
VGKLPVSQRIAVIDIGSNSVRLVIYDVLGASALPTFNEKVMAGLGAGLMKTGTLSSAGKIAALDALSRYRAILAALSIRKISAVATAAVRVAADGPDFVKAAEKNLGVKVSVLSGNDEARISSWGVEAAFHKPVGVIGDLGGSSLEFHSVGQVRPAGESLMLGPLSIARDKFEYKPVRLLVREALKDSDTLAAATGDFFAVGGAWRSFARIAMELDDYPLRVLQGYHLKSGPLARAVKVCVDSVKDRSARATLEAIDSRRVNSLPYAAVILEQILEVGALNRVIMSSYGLREGVLSAATGESEGDPLHDGIVAFARLDENQIKFGEALHEFLMDVFGPEADLFGSSYADARVDRAACLMADSAGRFHPDHRADQAYYQALRAPYVALDHAQRALIAHAVGSRYSRKFDPPKKFRRMNSDAQALRARQLGTAMRLGAVFSGRSGPNLKRAKLVRGDNTLELQVRESDKAMVSETVRKRLNQTAELLDLSAEVTFT